MEILKSIMQSRRSESKSRKSFEKGSIISEINQNSIFDKQSNFSNFNPSENMHSLKRKHKKFK